MSSFSAWTYERFKLPTRAGRLTIRLRNPDGRFVRDRRARQSFSTSPSKSRTKKAKDGQRIIPIMKTFAVFHTSQMDNVPPFTPPTVDEAPWTRPEATDIIL